MKNDNNKILIILTGFACNNNCIMCSLETIKQTHINRSTEELIAEIERGRNEGFERIEFTGGEAGIRKDIVYLIRYAKRSGFREVAMSTNGRIFSYFQFCKKLVESGLNRVNISLHGHNPKLHNAVARTPHSFEETLRGIRNIQKFPFVSLRLATLCCRINYNHLKKIGYFIFNSLDIKRWSVLDLIPDGNALPLYSSLSIKLFDLSKIIFDLFPLIPKDSHVTFFDFPLCIFPPLAIKAKFISFIAAKERGEIAEQRGYCPTRITKTDNEWIDKYKTRISICKNCVFNFRCGGVWRKYIEFYGEDEITALAEINGCIKNNAKNR